MATKQVRISEKLYQELDGISKKRHSSLTDTIDWVLQFKVDNVTLADTKPGAKDPDIVTKKIASEAYNAGYEQGWLHGSTVEKVTQSNFEIAKYLEKRLQQQKK